MPIMYKLVTQGMTSHAGMTWKIGKTNKVVGLGNDMCSYQVLHCYASSEQAVLFNTFHANIDNPILLQIDCDEIVNSDKLKYACKKQTPIAILPLPVISTTQKIVFAVKCALEVYFDESFAIWAENWIQNKDRSYATASYAAHAAANAVYAAYIANAAYDAASYAANAAANAAYDAANAAYDAANAASYASYAAAYAANAAARKNSIDFQEIILWVLENIKE